jgi:Holliday junction resolvase RusA-like endonuclease
MIEITIEGKLPHLNEYIQKERSNRFMGAKLKKEATDLVTIQSKRYAGKITEYPVAVIMNWYIKPNRGKYADPDNVGFGAKFVLDGLVHAGVLEDDTFKQIESITHQFEWGGTEDKVVVQLVN